MANKELVFTLEDAVAEVLAALTGLDLEYLPEQNRFKSTARALNRALRAVALEHEWSYFSDVVSLGTTTLGARSWLLPSNLRVRAVNDDAVRLVNDGGWVMVWAYFLPRDALHKYASRAGLWAAATRDKLYFSRPLWLEEAGLDLQVPCMREPKMFRLPKDGQEVPQKILSQPVDFDYPDLVVAKAAQLIAETDPVMQPRVQTLEAQYKDLMYQLIERDDRMTDSPYLNEFQVPIRGNLQGFSYTQHFHGHPHSDERFS